MARPCFGSCDPSIWDYAAYLGVILGAVAVVGLTYLIFRRLVTAGRVPRALAPIASVAVALALGLVVLPRYPQPTFVPSSVTAGLSGSGRTDAFYLQGSYVVTWSDVRAGPLTCPVDAELVRDADGVQVARLTAPVQQGAGATVTSEVLQALDGGGYYLAAASSCEWRVTLTPAPA